MNPNRKQILTGLGLTILIVATITFASGQITTQETGPSAINISIDPVTNVKETEATFQATLDGFNGSTYDAVLIYWNYSKDNSYDQPGPMTVETTERQVSVLQPEIDSNSQYNVEAYAEPIVWGDDSLMKNYQEAVSRASNVGSFPSELQPNFGNSYSFSQGFTTPCADGLYVSHDGSKLATSCSSGEIHFYNMSSPWDLHTASKISGFTAPYGHGLEFSPNGQKMFVSDYKGGVTAYDLSQPWNISTATKSANISTSYGSGIAISPMGTDLGVIRNDNDFEIYDLTTPWDITTASSKGSTSHGEYAAGFGLDFSSDGSVVITGGGEFDSLIAEQPLTNPWTPYMDSFSQSSTNFKNLGGDSVRGVEASPDGDRVFAGTSDGNVEKLER